MRAIAFVMAASLLVACGDDDAGAAAPDAAATHDAATHDSGSPEADAGHPVGPPAAMDAGSCELFGASEVCSECLGRECCAESTACHGQAACSALIDCARDCGSAAADDCRQACVDTNRTGVAPYNELVLCMGQRCRAECPFVTP